MLDERIINNHRRFLWADELSRKNVRFFALLLIGGPEEGRWVWFGGYKCQICTNLYRPK